MLLFFITGGVGIFTHFRKDCGNNEGFFKTNLKFSFWKIELELDLVDVPARTCMTRDSWNNKAHLPLLR